MAAIKDQLPGYSRSGWKPMHVYLVVCLFERKDVFDKLSNNLGWARPSKGKFCLSVLPSMYIWVGDTLMDRVGTFSTWKWNKEKPWHCCDSKTLRYGVFIPDTWGTWCCSCPSRYINTSLSHNYGYIQQNVPQATVIVRHILAF